MNGGVANTWRLPPTAIGEGLWVKPLGGTRLAAGGHRQSPKLREMLTVAW